MKSESTVQNMILMYLLVVVACLAMCGCAPNGSREQSKEITAVREAALKVVAYTEIGVTDVQLRTLVAELHAAITIAVDREIADPKRSEALTHYREAVSLYMGSIEFTEAQNNLASCIEQGTRAELCGRMFSRKIANAAKKAMVSPDTNVAEAATVTWAVAAKKIMDAKRHYSN